MGEPTGITVWKGDVINCTGQEISLFHDRYATIDSEGAHGECGGISGWSVRNTTITTNGDNSTTYYTSRLTVPISSDTEGKTVECIHDNGEAFTSVGKATINFTISTIKKNLPKLQ
jgi:hypothetical protein